MDDVTRNAQDEALPWEQDKMTEEEIAELSQTQKLHLLGLLRSDWTKATPEKKVKIEVIAQLVKKHLKLCHADGCTKVIPQDETGFCSEACRNEYWKNAKNSHPVTKNQLLEKLEEAKQRRYGKSI